MVVNSYHLTFAPFLYHYYISFPVNFIAISVDDIPLTFEWKLNKNQILNFLVVLFIVTTIYCNTLFVPIYCTFSN